MQLSNLREHFYKVSQFKVVDMLRLRQGKTDAKFGEKIDFNFLFYFNISQKIIKMLFRISSREFQIKSYFTDGWTT